MMLLRKVQVSCFLLMLTYVKASIRMVPDELALSLENGDKNFISGDIPKNDKSRIGTDPVIAAATGYLPAFAEHVAQPKRTAAFGLESTPHPELAPFLLLGRILQSSHQNLFSPMKHFEEKLRMETAPFVGSPSLVTSKPIYAGYRPDNDRQRHLEYQRALRQQGLQPHLIPTNAPQQQQFSVQNSLPASYSIHSSLPNPPPRTDLNGRAEVPVQDSQKIHNLNGQIEVPDRDLPRDLHQIHNLNGRLQASVRDSLRDAHHFGNQNGRFDASVRDLPHHIGNQNGRFESSLVRDSPHHIGNQNGRYEAFNRDSPHQIGNQNGRYEAFNRDSPHQIGNQNGRFVDSVRGSSRDLSFHSNQNQRLNPPVHGPPLETLRLTDQNRKLEDVSTPRRHRPLSESDRWNQNQDSLHISSLDILGRPLPIHERPIPSRYVEEKDPLLLEHSNRNRNSRYESFQNETPRVSPHSHGSDPIGRQRLYNIDYDRSVASREEETTAKPVPTVHQYGTENQSDPPSPVWKDEGREQRHLEFQPQKAEKKKRIKKRKRRREEDI